MAVNVKITLFEDVMSWSLVDKYSTVEELASSIFRVETSKKQNFTQIRHTQLKKVLKYKMDHCMNRISGKMI
jgi:hypothetical protein